MNQLKKVILFVILILCFCISASFAVDINVHPNNSSENQTSNNSVNNSTNETSINRTTSTPSVSTSSTSSRSENNKLTTSDVIDIIVASIGIVNLLLGIAILIRFK